jgi:peptidoglycan/xylan/chitin deacetylase (PgdA/CDA1 family)
MNDVKLLPSRQSAMALRGWSPAPVPQASLWLHGLGALAVAAQPQLWPQVLCLLACNHALLTALMHPRGGMLGPNMVRLPETLPHAIALTFDDGPDPEVTPRVLDLLDLQGAKASFFVIGERAQRHKALLRDMLRRGHTVENHSHRHPATFACRGPWALHREVAMAQRIIADATGVVPRFFRAPMGLRNPLLDPVLAAEGLSLVSWTRRGYDTRQGDSRLVLNRLARGLAGRDILLLHDGSAARDPAGSAVVLTVLPKLLDRIAAAGLSAASLAAVMPLPVATSEAAGR